MEIYELFTQLKEGSHIPIAKFIKIYGLVDEQHSLSAQQNIQKNKPQPNNPNAES